MFNLYHYYTHRNFIDTEIYIYRKQKEVSGKIGLDIYWFTKNNRFIGADRVLVKKEQFKNWRECE